MFSSPLTQSFGFAGRYVKQTAKVHVVKFGATSARKVRNKNGSEFFDPFEVSGTGKTGLNFPKFETACYPTRSTYGTLDLFNKRFFALFV